MNFPIDNNEHSTDKLLCVEGLEQRMMLSTVQVTAYGDTGEEVLVVTLNDNVISETQMLPNAEPSTVTVDVPDSAQPIDLKLEFRNDLYLPEQGVDRNIVIESFEFNGEELFDVDNIFSTGTWSELDGITPGYGRGNVLHANGFMRYDPNSQNIVGFDGFDWETSVPYTDEMILEDAGTLLMSGVNGPISVSRQADFDSGSLTKLSAEAFRDVLEGSFGSNGPWATVGVNFYDFNGNFVEQRTLEFNGSGGGPVMKETEFVSPENATSAFLWAWIDGFQPGTDIPLRLSKLQMETVDLSSDQTPPTASIAGTGVYTSARGSELDFGIRFDDETRLNSNDIQGGAIRIVGPNGIDQTPPVATGFNITETSVTLLYILQSPNGETLDSSFNGTYEVFLQENRFRDAAGNVAPGALIGTIELAIEDIVDEEPPTASLSNVGVPTTSDGSITFLVFSRDNNQPYPSVQGGVRVFNNAGFDQIVRSFAGGFDTPNDRFVTAFEIFAPAGGWSADDNGEYFIELPAGALVDQFGNATPQQILGSFEINL